MARRPVSNGGSLVLDSEGLTRLAGEDEKTTGWVQSAIKRKGRIIVSAITLTEVLRGTARDAVIHRFLRKLTVLPVTHELASKAGTLLGHTQLSGHRYAIDAVVAATALAQPRPVVLLTSDPEDLGRLVEEPERPRNERVAVVKI